MEFNYSEIKCCVSSGSIDDNMQVKITDNALARDLFPMDYHCLGDNENRPVRWMALESLLNNDFSSASDVVRPHILTLHPHYTICVHTCVHPEHMKPLKRTRTRRV